MSNKLYIGNLAFSATNESITAAFAKCGTVESAKVIMDRDSGRSKGFAFVEMSSTDEAAAVIEQFNGKDHEGRAMNISVAKPMTDRPRNRY